MKEQDCDDRFRTELAMIARAAPAYDPQHQGADENPATGPSRSRRALPYVFTVAVGASAAAILVGTGLWDPRTTSGPSPVSDGQQIGNNPVPAQTDRVPNPLTSGDETNVEAMGGASDGGPWTVKDLRQETVIIGDVIDTQQQPATGPEDDIWYPVYVTIRIDEQLTGDLNLPDEIGYWTQFITDDDHQIVLDGTPWLNPGDRLLATVMEEDRESDLFTAAGNWTIFEIVDDRVTLPDRLQNEETSGEGVAPPLVDELVGLTEDEAIDLIQG